jgi:hypothetical protein
LEKPVEQLIDWETNPDHLSLPSCSIQHSDPVLLKARQHDLTPTIFADITITALLICRTAIVRLDQASIP